MTYFESVGVEYQYSSTTIQEADKAFQKSCDKCSAGGKRILCDKCAIAAAHDNIKRIFIRS